MTRAVSGKMPDPIQNARIEVVDAPPDDFRSISSCDRYRHTPAFLGQKYSDDMILLKLTFILIELTFILIMPEPDKPSRQCEIANGANKHSDAAAYPGAG
jgi:hypothetical protein